MEPEYNSIPAKYMNKRTIHAWHMICTNGGRTSENSHHLKAHWSMHINACETASKAFQMNPHRMFDSKALALAACAAMIAAPAFAETVYNSIPAPLPTNLPSLGYEATGT